MAGLIIFSPKPSHLFLVYFLFLGLVALITYSLKTKQLMVINIYVSYVAFFFVLYFSSVHSDVYFVSYPYPLLFVTPLLFISIFLFIKGKAKYVIMAVFIIFILAYFEATLQLGCFKAVKEYHFTLKKSLHF